MVLKLFYLLIMFLNIEENGFIPRLMMLDHVLSYQQPSLWIYVNYIVVLK